MNAARGVCGLCGKRRLCAYKRKSGVPVPGFLNLTDVPPEAPAICESCAKGVLRVFIEARKAERKASTNVKDRARDRRTAARIRAIAMLRRRLDGETYAHIGRTPDNGAPVSGNRVSGLVSFALHVIRHTSNRAMAVVLCKEYGMLIYGEPHWSKLADRIKNPRFYRPVRE